MKIKEILQIKESASVGATSSGSIATVALPLGGWVGFNPNDQWRSIYNIKKSKKKKKTKF